MASVVCVLVKICVSSISLYKLDTDKLTADFRPQGSAVIAFESMQDIVCFHNRLFYNTLRARYTSLRA